MSPQSPAFVTWTQALIGRHQADLSFQEVRRGLQALSTQYVERRLGVQGDPLSGRGKRAAFAVYYAPLHLAVVAHVCQHYRLVAPARIYDWGCGTGVGAAAWAMQAQATPPPTAAHKPSLYGCDLSAWALGEARWNWRALGLSGSASRGDMSRQRAPAPADAGGIVLAFSVNELSQTDRDRLLQTVLQAAHNGSTVLVIEPIAKTISPWWPAWQRAFAAMGGESCEHKFANPLPRTLQAYAQAAKLDHRRLSARSLMLAPAGARA